MNRHNVIDKIRDNVSINAPLVWRACDNMCSEAQEE